MPSLFKGASVEALQLRREEVEREIASLVRFRDKIDRRIIHVTARDGDPEGPPMEIVLSSASQIVGDSSRDEHLNTGESQ